MQYITSFERLAREEGRQEATSNLLVHLLQHRFGEVPEDVQMRLSVLDIKPAAVIVDLALTCRSLADFVAHLPA